MIFSPMLAENLSSVDESILIDDSLVVEEKIDGHRIMLEFMGGNITARNRRGQPSQHQVLFDSPQWQRAWTGPDLVLDGELIDGMLMMFDVPYLEGLITPEMPWEVRRTALEGVSNVIPRRLALKLPVARGFDAKCALIQDCVARNAEGLVVKDVNASYYCGTRSEAFRKLKFTKTADLVVTKTHTLGKENATLALYDDGDLVEVGRCSLLGKPPVHVGDVVEVRYLYVSQHGRLYQPVLLAIRQDKDPLECTAGQLVSG